MTQYFRISNNSAYDKGIPEIYKIIQGLINDGPCDECGREQRYPYGNLIVELGKTRANYWSDIIPCGGYPCFVVSNNFIEVLEKNNVQLYVGGTVKFELPIPKKLSFEQIPSYYWIDGRKHLAAKMDFEASGFVDVRFCSKCGYRTDNVGLTYDRQHYSDPPLINTFYLDKSKRLELFTSDLSPTAFFCSGRVFDLIEKYNLTGFYFREAKNRRLG